MSDDDPFISKLNAQELLSLYQIVENHPQAVLDRLKMVETLQNLEPRNQLSAIGLLVDYGGDLGDERALSIAISLGEAVDTDKMDSSNRAMLNYRIGTAYSNRLSVTTTAGEDWLWENADTEDAIRYFRRAILEDGMERLPLLEQCRALTNLGNIYSSIGRFVEAFDFWNESLIRHRYFFQGYGQRGIGFFTYAQHLNDTAHRAVLLKKGYDELEAACLTPIHESMKQQFQRYQDQIMSHFISSNPPNELLEFDEYELGDSRREEQYRRWCLNHRLYLNPLNEVTDESIAARDVLQLGELRSEKTNRIVSCFGLWNHLVEEYVTARYLLFDGLHPEGEHFADNDVYLTNTLDYPIHSVYCEQTKIALRTAHSIFDKIGQFINYYFNCGREMDDLYFRDIWYKEKHGDELHEKFKQRPNLPLRGLYWLSKDFQTDDSLYVEGSLDTGGQELKDLRDGVEHRYVKLTEFNVQSTATTRFSDELATTMRRDEFETKALSMVRKARAGLIYLNLAIYHEERTKPDDDSLYAPL